MDDFDLQNSNKIFKSRRIGDLKIQDMTWKVRNNALYLPIRQYARFVGAPEEEKDDIRRTLNEFRRREEQCRGGFPNLKWA